MNARFGSSFVVTIAGCATIDDVNFGAGGCDEGNTVAFSLG